MTEPKPDPGRAASYLSPPEMYRLDLACKSVAEAFDETPYLVGSISQRRDFRDVDLRLMLKDEDYDNLLDALGKPGITFFGFAIGAWLESVSGLDRPIAFQIQRRTEANEKHHKPRNPMGRRHLSRFIGDA